MQLESTRTLMDVITDFLASDPRPEAILEYHLPSEFEQRAMELMERKCNNRLTSAEELEMYDFMCADDMMALLKAKTRMKLSGKNKNAL